jgi:LmbE family N-acetylglucosaminyl deacetylase
MNWIYLSPHLDDVALSVGGLIWEQSHAGERVSVWTICSGDPPPGRLSPFAEALHSRWKTGEKSMPVRRDEDIESCQLLGAETEHFSIPDCIYRRSPISGKHLYDSEEALWIPVHPDEEELVLQIADEMAGKLAEDTQVVCPLTLGNHVDHRLTHMAAERLEMHLLYYADYPYVLEAENQKKIGIHKSIQYDISSPGLKAWQKSIAAHQSQISTFWTNIDEMQRAIQEYCRSMDGIKLFN